MNFDKLNYHNQQAQLPEGDARNLPKGWEIKKLGEVCEIVNGSTPLRTNKEFWENGNFPWFTIDDIREQGRIITETKQKVTDVALTKLRVLPADTVLLCCTASVGEYAITKIELTTNQQFNGLVVKDRKKLHPEFLMHYCSTLKNKLLGLSGKTTIDFIAISKLKNLEIPLPPLPEQQRIVSILDEAFAAIDKAKANAEQNLSNANELFENAAQIIFTEKGNDWEEKLLGEFATFRNGINYTKGSKGEKVQIVGVKDFQKRYWVPENDLVEVSLDGQLNDTDLLQEGDILAVRSNGNPQLIGRTLLAGKIEGRVSHSGFTIRIRLESKEVSPNYLCHFLKIRDTRKKLVDSGNGVGIRSLNQGSLSSLVVPFPKSLKEQVAIVDKVDSIAEQSQKLKDIYQRKLDDLEELKKSVLQKAFAGELHLEAGTEPVEVAVPKTKKQHAV